jgi:hypothetical protein
MVRDWNGTIASFAEDEGRLLGEIEVMKERRRRICWSMWEFAYCPKY